MKKFIAKLKKNKITKNFSKEIKSDLKILKKSTKQFPFNPIILLLILLLVAKIKNSSKKIEKKAAKHPFTSLIVLLTVLFAVIAGNSYLNKPEIKEAIQKQIKLVSIYSVGDSPRIDISAIVEESNVITIVTQVGGVVQSVRVKPGQVINRGTTVAGLSSNYYGGNAATIQRQLAQVQNDNLNDTFDEQKSLISKQRDLANLQEDNADQLREITADSINETKELLELNEAMLSGVDTALLTATASAEISSLTAQKSQLLAGINQIKAALRQAKYQSSQDRPPSKLAKTSKELTLKQLDLQEKSLEMSKEISDLQLKLARVQESTMYPASPFAGTVERVFVKKGQVVSPGTPIATIKANTGSTQIIARVSQSVAAKASITQATIIIIDNQKIEIYPDHVSTVPTDGQLYSIVYSLPSEYQNKLVHSSHISISLPIGSPDTNSIIPFLPLEAVHQSEQESTVFILDGDTVVSIKVELGSINGRFIEIKSGLDTNAEVILNRDIIEGQKVSK